MNLFAQKHGLPSRDDLVAMRIWDNHFHGFGRMDQMMPYIERMGIERLFALGVGSWDAGDERDQRDGRRLEKWGHLVYGITIIDPGRPEESVAKIVRWIADGPAIGIKYSGGNRAGITCDHPNNYPIIERAAELDATIYIHTWIKVGGEPRHPGGANNDGESAPWHVANLAARYPDVQMICGHAGGDWELAVRAVRPHENVLFEFSGAEPWSGAADLALQELGEDRIVWGGHGPSRSFANELSKIYDADMTDQQRFKALGGNLRAYATPILQRKGYTFDP